MAAPRFDPATLTSAANDTFTVRRVFGDAYEHGATMVIPVARVWGATGSGSGGGEMSGHTKEPATAEDESTGGVSEGHGGGGGYATHVRAVGVFVVDDSGVHWQPTLDVNLVILGAQAVAAGVLTVAALAWAIKRR